MPMPSMRRSLPGASATRATATLSEGCRWIAEFSAVGSFAISRSSIYLPEQYRFADLFVQMDVQLAAFDRMHPQPRSIFGHRNLRRSGDDHEVIGLDSLQQLADVHM